MESAGVDAISISVDSITNSLAYATTLSTYARAAARIRHKSNSRWFSRAAREFLAIAQQNNVSVPYDQLHTADPLFHHIMCTMRNHCVGGCIAIMYNLQTQHNKQFHAIQNNSCRTSQKLGANPSDGQRSNHVKQKVATRMPYEVHAQMQKLTMLVKHNRILTSRQLEALFQYATRIR